MQPPRKSPERDWFAGPNRPQMAATTTARLPRNLSPSGSKRAMEITTGAEAGYPVGRDRDAPSNRTRPALLPQYSLPKGMYVVCVRPGFGFTCQTPSTHTDDQGGQDKDQGPQIRIQGLVRVRGFCGCVFFRKLFFFSFPSPSRCVSLGHGWIGLLFRLLIRLPPGSCTL